MKSYLIFLNVHCKERFARLPMQRMQEKSEHAFITFCNSEEIEGILLSAWKLNIFFINLWEMALQTVFEPRLSVACKNFKEILLHLFCIHSDIHGFTQKFTKYHIDDLSHLVVLLIELFIAFLLLFLQFF